MKRKGKILFVLITIMLFTNAIIAYAATKGGNMEGKYGGVYMHYYLDRTAAPFYDYNSWKINFYGSDVDALVYDYDFTYVNSLGKTQTVQYGRNVRAFADNDYDENVDNRLKERISYKKNTKSIGLKVSSDSFELDISTN